jgi:ubiquinone/menaquinone biosynthesis C-methylase UbiE
MERAITRIERVAKDPGSHPAVPDYSLKGLRVLDVGCGTGYAFGEACFAGAELYGIDVNPKYITRAELGFPEARFRLAPAEAIPYERASFDCVVSRVSLPYTNIPDALREIHRVLKPGGRVFFTVHDFQHHFEFAWIGVKEFAGRRLIDLTFVTFASVVFSLFGKCIKKPWNGKIETVQTEGRMRKEMEAAGFRGFTFKRQGRHRVVEGIKPDLA